MSAVTAAFRFAWTPRNPSTNPTASMTSATPSATPQTVMADLARRCIMFATVRLSMGAAQFPRRLAARVKAGLNQTIVYLKHLRGNYRPVEFFGSTACCGCPEQSLFGTGGVQYGFMKALCVGRHNPRVGFMGVGQNAAARGSDERES